jgi:hypothetical protein
MSVGPVEVVVYNFPGSQFNGQIAPALVDAVAEGDIRILDLVFVVKTDDDEIEVLEIDDLDDDVLGELSDAVSSAVDLLSDDDLDLLTEEMEVGSSLVAIVFEHAWAARLSSAIRGAKGELVFNERIPASVVAAAIEAARADA